MIMVMTVIGVLWRGIRYGRICDIKEDIKEREARLACSVERYLASGEHKAR